MEFTEYELQRLFWLRAVEWANWPIFLSYVFAPILLIFIWWPYVLAGFLILDILWAIIRYSFVSLKLANMGAILVVRLKWAAAIIAAIYLFIQGRYISGALALLWQYSVVYFCIPAKIGLIELAFAKKADYVDDESPPS
jgi:hypothetical protein